MRTNEEWLRALRADGIEQEEALKDLRERLLLGMRAYLAEDRGYRTALALEDAREIVEDCAQEALLIIRQLSGSFSASLDEENGNRNWKLFGRPLRERRWPLEVFFTQYLAQNQTFQLSSVTRQIDIARRWLEMDGGRLDDGIIAKRLDLTYQSGRRTGMQKIKHMRTPV
jgi:hypothetical protein